MTMLLVASLLVNALCMSAIMTEEMEHSAEHLVAKTNQLRAVRSATVPHAAAAAPSGSAKHAPVLHAAGGPPSARSKTVFSAWAGVPLADSSAAHTHKARAATHVLSHLGSLHAKHKPVTLGEFNIDEFRLALLKRREEREMGEKPITPLRNPIQLRGAGENPNTEPAGLVDSRGAFFDPKLNVLVDAKLLGTRAEGKVREAVVLEAEKKAADVYLPQLGDLKTEDDAGHLVSMKADEASQLANGIFTWGYENPDTGDFRVDCTDTLANAGSNGGKLDRFWGGKGKGDACGPRDPCADECAYKPCNTGTVFKIECPGNCAHYGADVFGGAGRTDNIFMDDSSICRAALSVGVGSRTSPFFVDIEVVEAQPAYQGRLNMEDQLTTFNYVWHKWDWSENPKYSTPYSSAQYACCSNPGAGAVPHLGEFTPTAEFRMRYDGVKWVNRVAFTVLGGVPPPDPTPKPDPPKPGPIDPPIVCKSVPDCNGTPPADGEKCCPTPDDRCMQPDAPSTCPCGGLYTAECPVPPPKLDCSTNMALQFNGAQGDGAELEDSTSLQGKFQEKSYAAVTVEMWIKDNTMPMHRTVYFGGGEFDDQGFNVEESCIQSGFALGQWNGMLTFDVASEVGVAGKGCGVHVRSPDWVLGTHKGKWVHVAGTYSSATGETNLYIDGQIVHTDLEGSGPIVWPDHDDVKFVMGRNGDFFSSSGGTTGMDGEVDEVRVWTEARSLENIIGFMHKSTPDSGAFGAFPMATVALYFRFECQQALAETYHRLCSNAEWPMAIELGSYPSTHIVESEAPIELLTDPLPDRCPSPPTMSGPTSWSTWSWEGGASGAKSVSYALATSDVKFDRFSKGKSIAGMKSPPAHQKLHAASAKSKLPHHTLQVAAHRMLAHSVGAKTHVVWDLPGTNKKAKKAIWHRGLMSTHKSLLHKRLAGSKKMDKAALFVSSQAY